MRVVSYYRDMNNTPISKSQKRAMDQKIISANSGQPIETKVLGSIPRPLPQVQLERLKGKPDYSFASAEKLVGGVYESYGGGIDQIMGVKQGPYGLPMYRVRDVLNGEPERTHGTFIDPRGVTFPKGMEYDPRTVQRF